MMELIMKKNILNVELGSHSYPIIFGARLLHQAGELLNAHFSFKRAVIITDNNVAKHYLEPLQNSLQDVGIKAQHFVIAAGESSKSFANYQDLCEKILELQPDRHTAIIALGGGVVGDLAGFVASTLLRGLPFVQIPTTLLSQVDSSVGGKVAINAKAGKNLVGAFYQPKIVLMDLDTLSTLTHAELLSGYGEVVKYGLLGDADFYERLLELGGVFEIANNNEITKQIIKHCCAMKAEIVAEDEKEQGRRALLNLGHTFAHAMEKMAGYQLLHGQAVALGCLMAMRLSELLGYDISQTQINDLQNHFKAINMPTKIADFAASTNWDVEELVGCCYGDKKASNGSLNFVVLHQIGMAALQKGVAPELVKQVFNEFL
jgi:3-dehydroquinate synthase